MKNEEPGSKWLLRDFDKTQPHPLTTDEIDRLVKPATAGRYLIGYLDGRGSFRIQHVAFSPTDLAHELRTWIGSGKAFKFRVELPGPGGRVPVPEPAAAHRH